MTCWRGRAITRSGGRRGSSTPAPAPAGRRDSSPTGRPLCRAARLGQPSTTRCARRRHRQRHLHRPHRRWSVSATRQSASATTSSATTCRTARQGSNRAGSWATTTWRTRTRPFVYAARAGQAVVAEPYEGIERMLERVAEFRDRRRPPWRYEVIEQCEERVHELIGAEWPCKERQEFGEVWSAGLDELAARGLQIGRGA